MSDQLLESAKSVEKQLRFAHSYLVEIRKIINPGRFCESRLTRAFKTFHREFSEIQKHYSSILSCLEKARPFYPSQNQANIQKKITVIKETIKHVEKVQQDFKNIQLDIEGLPVVLFEHKKEAV